MPRKQLKLHWVCVKSDNSTDVAVHTAMLTTEIEAPEMTEFLLVLTATSSPDEAQAIADGAVEKQLAAAVHVIGPITSTFRWNQQHETTQEWLCVIKTRQALYAEVERLIHASHSYELPGIIALPVIAGSEAYLAWYARQTQ